MLVFSVTVTVAEALNPPSCVVAVIVALPFLSPLIDPSLTVATLVLDDFHVTFLLLALLGHILVGISSSVISNLFSMIKGYTVIHTVIHSILSVVWFIIEFIILVHVFKIRYLNYYDKAKEEKKNTDNSDESKDKIKLEKKENVVIRDGKDRPFAFLSVLSKIVIFFIKLFLAWIALILMFTCPVALSGTLTLILTSIPGSLTLSTVTLANDAALGTSKVVEFLNAV